MENQRRPGSLTSQLCANAVAHEHHATTGENIVLASSAACRNEDHRHLWTERAPNCVRVWYSRADAERGERGACGFARGAEQPAAA